MGLNLAHSGAWRHGAHTRLLEFARGVHHRVPPQCQTALGTLGGLVSV